MTIVTAWPRLLGVELARTYVGGRAMFDAMKKKGFIGPKTQNPSLYDRLALDNAIDSLPSGFSASAKNGKHEEEGD